MSLFLFKTGSAAYINLFKKRNSHLVLLQKPHLNDNTGVAVKPMPIAATKSRAALLVLVLLSKVLTVTVKNIVRSLAAANVTVTFRSRWNFNFIVHVTVVIIHDVLVSVADDDSGCWG